MPRKVRQNGKATSAIAVDERTHEIVATMAKAANMTLGEMAEWLIDVGLEHLVEDRIQRTKALNEAVESLRKQVG